MPPNSCKLSQNGWRNRTWPLCLLHSGRFYFVHNPSAMGRVDAILLDYRHHTDLLLDRLRDK